MTDETKDLALLERVLLKLGLSETDQQLEQQLNKFLAPVLLKITSPSENVRKKVMEIFTHVNKRLKSRPEVKLDLVPLLKNYQESNNSFLINFAIIYITLGFPRLDIEKQTELAPIIMNSLDDKPEPHQNKLMMLILPLLGEIKLSDDLEERKKFFGTTGKPNPNFTSILLDVLLLPYGHSSDVEIPPGMSSYSYKRVSMENKKAEYLEQIKKGIVKFLGSGVFEDSEIIAHLIVGSADTRFSVATPALNELNKICTTLDWFDARMTSPLYSLFSGNGSKIPERKTSGCGTRVKHKILQHLLKCRGNAINVAKGIQMIFESLFGESTNQKCKVSALQFSANLIQYGQRDLIIKLSKVLQTGITKLLGSESSEPQDVQNAAYNAIAKLITVSPETFNKDVNVIVQYFNYLQSSSPDMHNTIRDVFVAMAQAFKWDPSKEKSKQEPMELDEDGNVEHRKFIENFTPTSNHLLILGAIQEQVNSKLPIAQNIASLFLTTCFPTYYVQARYLLLLLCGSCPQLRETIYVHLYGSSRKDHINHTKLVSVDTLEENANETELLTNHWTILAAFKPMIYYVSEIAERKMGNPTERFTYKNHKLPFHVDAYGEILEYLRYCLWYSAGCASEPGSDNELHKLSTYISELHKHGNLSHIEKYVTLIRTMIASKRGIVELSCLSDLLNSSPSIVTKLNLDLMQTLNGSLKEVNETTRTLVAKIFGILVAYGKDMNEFSTEINDLLNVSQKSLELQHGNILALSNALFHYNLRYRAEKNTVEIENLYKSKVLSNSVEYLIKLLTDSKSLLTMAAIKGLSMIACVMKLPIEETPPITNPATDEAMDVDETVMSKEYVFKTVLQLLKSSQIKQKIREDAAHCLGHLAIGDGEFYAKKSINGFLDLKRVTKDAAIHIAIAQGLVYAVNGDDNLPSELNEPVRSSDELLEWLLDELIKIVPEVNVCSRQAVSLWLLAIVKNCSKRKPIIDKRRILQMAFTNLLGEDNELVQDVASRGLGIIFSLSSVNDQSELSTLLLDQLTDGNKRQTAKVSDDTVLFEEGVLGKAPTGGNLTTYKELCSLASDLNQPEMIYQFMQLANHNASWNSRLGAAFGLQSISGVAKENMKQHLGKIVPRLFRYKYDPTPKIQNSMISIWDTVVANQNETLELYYWDILADVTSNLTHPEWRTRIACCLAIRDLIRRPTGLRLRTDEKKVTGMEVDGDVPEPEIRKLWEQLFRVMDDIHEGTRETAVGTANLLAKLCVVSVSCDHGKNGMNVSASILPFLLEIGVTHTVPEIRKLSLKTVSDMIDSSGSFIHPHLSELIPCLLRATGELESTKLSMLSTMLGAQAGTQEMVDSVRAETAKSHYTMETLTKCIKYFDYPTLEKTTPAVIDLAKNSVNLGTKIASAHFICLVSIQLSNSMMPLVGKYLSVCLTALNDRNTVVRKYYASAIGHLIGIAKDTTVISLFKKLNNMYFEEIGKSKSIALTLNAINKKHADIIKDSAKSIMPLIFFAKHEESTEETKSTVEMWQDLWNDVSFGDSMLQAHFDSMLEIIEKALKNQSWLFKSQAGHSITTIAKRLENTMKDEDRNRLIELVLANVSGRTFDGKERLVEALAYLCTKTMENKELKNKAIEAILKECRKEEEIYRTKVLKSLGDVLERLEDENRFEDVYNMLWILLDKQSISSSNDDEAGSSTSTNNSLGIVNEERNRDKVTLINLKEVVCETMGKAWPSLNAPQSLETQKKYQLMLIIKLTECLKINTRPIQKSLMVALGKFLQKLHLLNEMQHESMEKRQKVYDDSETLHKICELVMVNVSEAAVVPHTGLKKEALQSYLILVKKLKILNNIKELTYIQSRFDQLLVSFQKDSSPEVKLRLQDINDQFKTNVNV